MESRIATVSWGIEAFDHATGGLPANDISIIETPNYHSGVIVLGKYILEGLENGERCAFVSFDATSTFLANFMTWNIDFQQYLDNEQLIYLHYKPDIVNEVGLTYDYKDLFQEINKLCNYEAPDRVAFHHIDALINMNNISLINSSCQKISIASNCEHTKNTSVLGQFVQFNDKNHQNIRIACEKTMAGYFSLSQPDANLPKHYQFETRKLPWFQYNPHKTNLDMIEGIGFADRKINCPISA